MNRKCMNILVIFILLLNAAFAQQNDDSARDIDKSKTDYQKYYDNTEADEGVFIIKNVGVTPLMINSITDDGPWHATTGYPSPPFTILPGGGQQVDVSIDWTQIGTSPVRGTITISSDDPDEPSAIVDINAIPNPDSLPAPENLVALTGYDGAVPLYWDPPAGYPPLKMENRKNAYANSANYGSNINSNNSIYTQRNPGLMLSATSISFTPATGDFSATDQVLQSYTIYRSTNPGGPYTLTIIDIDRQYYRDMTAINGVTYYYVVTAKYDSGESGYSNEDDGTPVLDGYVINSGFANTPPSIDGIINASEWSDATVTDISATGAPNPVSLYTMNDGTFLYLAVDDPNDTIQDLYDELFLYFDEDHNFEWPMSSPSGEGNFWTYGWGLFTDYRGISGWWPNNLVLEAWATAAGVNQASDFSSGHIQWEVQFDLSASELNAAPGTDIGWYMSSYDDASISIFANWPTDILPFGGGTWSGPFSYGTLVLATPSITPTAGMLYASTGAAGGTLITIDPATGAGTPIAPQGAFGPVTEIEFRGDSVLFGATGQFTSNIITIDPVTGLETLIGTHPFGSTNGLEFDGSGNLLGTYFYSGGVWFTELVIIDQTTGSFSMVIGPTGILVITGLALHPNGTLYGSEHNSGPSASSLITIDATTGAATLVGPIGFDNVGALEFGPDGILYGGIGSQGGAFAGHLITIDPITGAGTDVGPSGFPGISGLSFYPGGCTPGLLGDVDGDGFVNSTDALIILSYDAGMPIPAPILERINRGFGDGNADGFTNSTDALLVLSYDVGINVQFPVGDPVCL